MLHRIMSHAAGLLSAALFFLAGLPLLPGTVAAADDPRNDTCLGCHGTAGFAGPDGRALFTNAEVFAASVHGALACSTCHAGAEGVPHTANLPRPNLETCAACHSAQLTAYRQSVHGRAHGSGIKEAAACADCHGPIHTVLNAADRNSAAHRSNVAATCARCHATIDLTQRSGIPLVRPVGAYLEGVHGRAVAAGRNAAVCSDCHGAHDIRSGADPRSPVGRATVTETCGRCHVDVLAAYRDSVHGTAAARGVRESPLCTDCHGEHLILASRDPASHVFAINLARQTCGRCHGDERLSQKYGLSVGKVSSFDDSYHGLALRSGQPRVANCASCHGVHNILRASDPRSLVNAANLSRTCGECHPGAGARFALAPVHGGAAAIGTVAVGWIRFIYLCMIGGTIGLMALHNLLDFTQKVRHPAPPPPAVPADQSERMPRPVRWQHGLVLVSFPVLVYTGFALNYPESWWAAPLVHWETRFPLRGLLHRIAAVVMTVAVLWHVGHLAVSARMRACMRGMWPSARDLRDALAMLAYYFGRRATRPHMGKFSYTEKVEYWAFLWGTAVMTVTGILLWFVNITLQYLPSWVADVATAIHFYEAILATLSILVWHFYWVIFDPDVYPVDKTFWNGHPPATRVLERAEERPSSAGPLPGARKERVSGTK